MEGRTVGQYQILTRLGAGGMGMVYRAKDLKLGRAVAIKMLAPSLAREERAKARFLREAQSASALDHPNIGVIHQIIDEADDTFIVMALYEGETLKQRLAQGPVPLEVATPILREVACGVAAAHRANIIHRDLKPANIMLTRAGPVKILDFGLAKLISSTPDITLEGEALGTVTYASPEQLRADQPIDQRSDLWAIGVIAYEMLSGVCPFKSDSLISSIQQVLQYEPPPLVSVPGVTPEFSNLVARLLQKDPAKRFASTDELITGLDQQIERADLKLAGWQRFRTGSRLPRSAGRWAALAIALATALAVIGSAIYRNRSHPSTIDHPKSLIVLPFATGPGSSDIDYLADGITETLIDNLSQVQELRVISRTSAFRYKGKDIDLSNLLREFSVDVAVTGRVQRVGDWFSIHADLVNIRDGSQIWGSRYTVKEADLLSVQEQITRATLDKLRPALTSEVLGKVAKRYRGDSETYQLYLLGRHFWRRKTKEALFKSINYFQQAIQIDGGFALAHAGLADAYASMASSRYLPEDETFRKAEQAAKTALKLDDDLAEAHAALGLIRLMHAWDWEGAERELKRAIELNPNDAAMRNSYGGVYLQAAGRFPEALVHLYRGRQLDPASGPLGMNIGQTLCWMGDYDRGIAVLKETIELDPTFPPAHSALAVDCYLRKKMHQEAVAEMKIAFGLLPGHLGALCALGYVYAMTGNRGEALKIVNEAKGRIGEDSSLPIAEIYIALGDKDQAFEWLEKAYQRHSHAMMFVKSSPIYEPLRSDGRFANLIARIGFPR